MTQTDEAAETQQAHAAESDETPLTEEELQTVVGGRDQSAYDEIAYPANDPPAPK